MKANFFGDPNVGLYGFATERCCLLGCELPLKLTNKIHETLKVDINTITVAGTELAGIFAAGNSSGVVLPKIAEKQEIAAVKRLGINVAVLKSKETALGNMIVCNDKGCLVSERLKKFKKEIADALCCSVETGKIASLQIVGSASAASNKGCLLHRDCEEQELRSVEELLGVKADLGSINGSPFVKAGIIANKNGVVCSEEATGPELQRISEVFE